MKAPKEFVFLLFACGAVSVSAEVALPRIFSDHMVLQQKLKNVPIWGTAAAGEVVTVKFNGQTKTATTTADKKWKVLLDQLVAGGPFTMTVSGKNTLSIKDILVGDVWHCAGQSNMATDLQFYRDRAVGTATIDKVAPFVPFKSVYVDEINQVNLPKLRYYRDDYHRIKAQGGWVVVNNPDSALPLSATGFFFAKNLMEATKQPVGLVMTSVGGTAVEQWLDPQTISTIAANKRDASFGNQYQYWAPRIFGYGIRGTLWFQGEANSEAPTAAKPFYGWDNYEVRFKSLITAWRRVWGQGDFPFYFAQLSNVPFPANHIAEIREAQRRALILPNTAMIATMDIGIDQTWHFPNKPEVGRRFSLVARALLLGENVEYSGPTLVAALASGKNLILKFDHVGNGLEVHGEALTNFEVSDKQGNWFPAKAVLGAEKGQLVVSSAQVAAPTKARYAYLNKPVASLFNSSALPAPAFVTDIAVPTQISPPQAGGISMRQFGTQILFTGIAPGKFVLQIRDASGRRIAGQANWTEPDGRLSLDLSATGRGLRFVSLSPAEGAVFSTTLTLP